MRPSSFLTAALFVIASGTMAMAQEKTQESRSGAKASLFEVEHFELKDINADFRAYEKENHDASVKSHPLTMKSVLDFEKESTSLIKDERMILEDIKKMDNVHASDKQETWTLSIEKLGINAITQSQEACQKAADAFKNGVKRRWGPEIVLQNSIYTCISTTGTVSWDWLRP